MKLPPLEYHEPRSVEEALKIAQQLGMDGQVIAGGTVVIPMMKHRLLQPRGLIALDRIDELRGVQVGDGVVHVGPLMTHWDMAEHPDVRRLCPLLAEACARVASPVIRSMGTIGGNVCYGETASDPPPALLALGARLTMRSEGHERTVNAQDFFLGLNETDVREGEILTDICISVQPSDATWTYFKWTPRAREDKPLVGLAAILGVQDGICQQARLAVSGVGDRPVLLPNTSAYLIDNEFTFDAVERAAEIAANEIEPISDLQGSGSYRRNMLRVWVARILRNFGADGT